MARDYGYIIPRDIDDFFRRAMIPEFPSLFKKNPGDVSEAQYDCDDFFVHVEHDVESLCEESLSVEQLNLVDSRFQHAIGNWLIDKKAREGTDEIEGNLNKLAKDIYGQHKVRDEDYRILLANLKSLSALQYYVCFKDRDLSFCLIRNFEHDEGRVKFTAQLGENFVDENLVPQVVNKDGEELGPYTTKRPQDLYPKQDRFEFNMRQYLATIKNNKHPIWKSGGDYLLNQFGYLSHCKEFNQKYRNETAEIMVESTYRRIAREYGLIVERNKGNASPNVKKRFYSANFQNNSHAASIPKEERDVFVLELAKFIETKGHVAGQGEKRYVAKAKQLIRQYGYEAVKNNFEETADSSFTFEDLLAVLELSSKKH